MLGFDEFFVFVVVGGGVVVGAGAECVDEFGEGVGNEGDVAAWVGVEVEDGAFGVFG